MMKMLNDVFGSHVAQPSLAIVRILCLISENCANSFS